MGLILLLITILLSYLLCCRDTGQGDTRAVTQTLHGTQVTWPLVVTLLGNVRILPDRFKTHFSPFDILGSGGITHATIPPYVKMKLIF